MIRLWSDRAGTVGKRSWGRRKPEGEGRLREKEQEGLAPSLGLGEGGPVMGMSFGQKKGTHRPSRWFFICACKALLPAAP